MLIVGATCLAILLLADCFVAVPWWVYAFVLWAYHLTDADAAKRSKFASV